MVDDQDRCEWVNVSSGTGLLGLSWTKGVKWLLLLLTSIKTNFVINAQCLQCFDAVGWATGGASGL